MPDMDELLACSRSQWSGSFCVSGLSLEFKVVPQNRTYTLSRTKRAVIRKNTEFGLPAILNFFFTNAELQQGSKKPERESSGLKVNALLDEMKRF
jgi:hypothetical protein